MTATKRDPAKDAAALESIRSAYESLKKIRESKTVALKPTPMLRTELVGPNGQTQPFHLRYYQVQGIYHLLTMKRMVLGDGTGLGKCVVGSTLLRTQQGLLPISELRPEGILEEGFHLPRKDTQVWTGKRYAKVRRFYWSGQKPTIRVTSRNGFQVEGSLIHPVLVRSKAGEEVFRTLSEIQEGDFVCVDRSPSDFPTESPGIKFDSDNIDLRASVYHYPRNLTESLAVLLGYIVAEGHSTKYATTVTQHLSLNPEPHREIRALLKSVFGWEGNEGNKARDVSIVVSSIGIRDFLRVCGIGNELSKDKVVPWVVRQGTREQVRGFLSAIIEAEGSVAEGGVEFSSASEHLVREVQLLLLQFGIVSTLSPKWNAEYERMYWRVTFFGDGARTFRDIIGFRSERKRSALDQSLGDVSNPNKDLVPHAVNLVEGLKAKLLEKTSRRGPNDNRKGSGIKQYGESFQSTLKHILNGHRDPTFQWLRKFLQIAKDAKLAKTLEYKEVEAVVSSHYFYDPVVRVEHSEAEVMDIEVEDEDHCFSANGLINHNTAQILGFFAYLWSKEAESKAIVVAPKSALRQWASEIERFTTGIRTFVVSGGLEERKQVYEAFAQHKTGPGEDRAVLILNYAILVRDWNYGSSKPLLPNGQPDPRAPVSPGLLDKLTAALKSTIVVYDECTAFKNPSTKTWQVCRFLSDRSNRVYGLTATLLKNTLMEGFGIFKCINPSVFTTKTKFMEDYCVVKLQPVPGGRKIPVVVGYKNLEAFRQRIDPYFLGRPKHVVSDELPTLITKEVVVELKPAEVAKYREALSGVLELGDGQVKDYEEHKAFVALTYCQQVVDSLTLLKFTEGNQIDIDMFHEESATIDSVGTKEQALLDLLEEDFDGEKVIVYTRFSSLVPRLQAICEKIGIKSVAITGAVQDTAKNPARQRAQQAFQDPESDVRVIFITDAGSEAINLQAASAMIFYDAPWSWGNYVQLLGRPIRIGSKHQHVVAVHLIAERPGKGKDRKTIDRYTLELLEKKKDLVDKVLGESAVGALDFGTGASFTRELANNLRSER